MKWFMGTMLVLAIGVLGFNLSTAMSQAAADILSIMVGIVALVLAIGFVLVVVLKSISADRQQPPQQYVVVLPNKETQVMLEDQTKPRMLEATAIEKDYMYVNQADYTYQDKE